MQLAALAQAEAAAAQSFKDDSSELSVSQTPVRNKIILAWVSSGVDEMKLDEERGGFHF